MFHYHKTEVVVKLQEESWLILNLKPWLSMLELIFEFWAKGNAEFRQELVNSTLTWGTKSDPNDDDLGMRQHFISRNSLKGALGHPPSNEE